MTIFQLFQRPICQLLLDSSEFKNKIQQERIIKNDQSQATEFHFTSAEASANTSLIPLITGLLRKSLIL